MKAPALFACLCLTACMQSERYGDYSYSSTVAYGGGQTVTQSDYGQWREVGHTPPQASFHYQDGNNSLHVQTPRPAPQPQVIHYYPVYPQAAPTTPYIRSQQTILPTCTQQRTVRHGGQTVVVQQPCY